MGSGLTFWHFAQAHAPVTFQLYLLLPKRIVKQGQTSYPESFSDHRPRHSPINPECLYFVYVHPEISTGLYLFIDFRRGKTFEQVSFELEVIGWA